MEYLKTIGIACAAITIYHFITRKEIMRKFNTLQKILRTNIRTQSYILNRVEGLEDIIYLENMSNSDESDDDSEDENVILPESSESIGEV